MSRTTEWVITEMNNTETKPTVKPGTKTPPKVHPGQKPFKGPKVNPDHRPKGINQQTMVITEQMLDEMCAALGGRAAEKIIFNKTKYLFWC